MQDRLAASGRVEALAAAPSLALQFPRRCHVRQHFWLHATRPAVTKVVLMKAETAQGRPRAWVDSHHLAGYRRYGMRCRALGYFAHYTLTAQALRAVRGIKLARGHAYRRDGSQRKLYSALAAFADQHRTADARLHAWCRDPPPQPAARDVTLYTNSLLDYCGLTGTRLGGARAV